MFSFLFKRRPVEPENRPPESRRCPRVTVPSEEWRVVIRSFSGTRLSPRLLNVSATGLAFQADRKQGELSHEDDRMSVELFIPRQRQTLTLTGRLVWLYKHPRDPFYRGGIRFGKLPLDQQNQVIAYLEAMLAAGGTVIPLEDKSA